MSERRPSPPVDERRAPVSVSPVQVAGFAVVAAILLAVARRLRRRSGKA